jgi:pimeloyl-ACP methyl ester carboxylesterase
MKKLLLFIFSISLGLVSCGDVASAMFFGGEGNYTFSNDELPAAYQVDESKVHVFTLESGTEDTIYALYLGDYAQIQEDTVILYLHGNARSMDVFWEAVANLAHLGGTHNYGVMMYDYRGYGKSTGTTTGGKTMAEDYNAAINYLKDNGLTSDRLVVFANSLGSLPAGPAAAGESSIAINKLVMEVPQSNSNVILQDATGLSLPASMVTSYDFDLGADMANYPGELLWMHGTADDVAPIHSAESAMNQHEGSYFKAAIYEGGTHGLRSYITPEVWSQEVLEFIRH